GALLGLVIDAFGLAGGVFSPAGGQQIGLLPEIEELAVRPVWVLEAVVAWRWLDHWLHILLAEEPANRAAPKLRVVLEELVLRGGELAGLAHPLPGDLAERLGRLVGLRRHTIGTRAVTPLRQCAEDLSALVEQSHHVACENVPVSDLILLNLCLCHGLVLFLHGRSRPYFTPG